MLTASQLGCSSGGGAVANDKDLLNSDHEVSTKGFDGQWRTKQGLWGPKKDQPILGSALGREARTALGSPITNQDGEQLYERRTASPSTWSGEDQVASAGAIGIVAVVVATVASVFGVVFWMVLRFASSVRSDFAHRRLSASTLGFGCPVAAVVLSAGGAMAGGSLDGRGSSPATPVVQAGLLLALASYVLLCLYPALRLAASLRGLPATHRWGGIVGWGLASAATLGLNYAGLTSPNTRAQDTTFFWWTCVAIGAAFVYGLVGRPDPVRFVLGFARRWGIRGTGEVTESADRAFPH
jgi:hypothetical protein